MEAQQLVSHRPQRVRQPISVPFLWEEKPGTPKRDWQMPEALPLISIPSPARLIISVPFEWEEKPGKPLLQLPQPSPDALHPSAPQVSHFSFPTLAYSTNPFFIDEGDKGVFGWEAFGMNPPLLPILQETLSEDSSNQHENWYSVSETDCYSSSSSSAPQNACRDPSVLEFLFPLSSPDAGFLNKVSEQARIAAEVCPELLSEKSCRGDRHPLVKRTLTLGELILLSRKLSYRRKAIEVRKPRLSVVILLLQCYSGCIASKTALKESAYKARTTRS